MDELSHDYIGELKTVFNACDHENSGYISIEYFRKLIHDYFPAIADQPQEVVTSVIQILDPEAKGQISFENFCTGVLQIRDTISLRSPTSTKFETDSLETIVPSDLEFSPIKSIIDTEASSSTYAEYDLPTDEDSVGYDGVETFNGLLDYSTPTKSLFHEFGQLNVPHVVSEDDVDSAVSGRSSEFNDTSRPDVTDEENFEDFGEREGSEVDITDLSFNASRNHNGTLSELRHKRRSPRERRDYPSKLRHTGPNQRVSSAASARQLHRNSPAGWGSLGSDEDAIDGDCIIHDKVSNLEEKLLELADNQNKSDCKQTLLKEENTHLVRKILGLEEQLHDMELRSDERIIEENRKNKDHLARQTREKDEQIEYMTQRLHRLEKDYDETRLELTRVHAERDRVKEEKINLQDRLHTISNENAMLQEERDVLIEQKRTREQEWEKERLCTGQLLDELGKELEELRHYKIDIENGHRPRTPSMADLPSRYRDLQMEAKRLHEENSQLRSVNEDLQAQLISEALAEGRSLLHDDTGISLAEEMENMDKEGLMKALKDQQEVNLRLRQYLDTILLTIIEKQPSLLEVKH